MNCITVSGGTKRKRALVESVAEFMVQQLLPRHRTLDIEIILSNLMKDSGVCGFCNAYAEREFMIELDKTLDHYDLIETVCHEMIHLKQYARRELRQDANGNTMWKKKAYNTVDYWDAPWEKEAFKLEGKLATECFQQMKVVL